MLQAKGSSSVDFNMLSPEDQKVFDVTRRVDLQGLLDLTAYPIMSLEESRRFRLEHPVYIYIAK